MDFSKYTSSNKEDLYRTGIYVIEHCDRPGHYYVGSAAKLSARCKSNNGFYVRWSRHLRDLEKGNHHNLELQRTVNKYGIDNLWFSIVEFVEPDCCLERETYWIKILRGYSEGYNRSEIADRPSLGQIRTEEQRQHLSRILTGRQFSEQTLKRMSEARKGWVYTDEQRKQIQEKSPNKKTVFVYNLQGQLVHTFPSSVECDRHFGVKKGLTSSYIQIDGFIKKQYFPRYEQVLPEAVTKLVAERKEKIRTINHRRDYSKTVISGIQVNLRDLEGKLVETFKSLSACDRYCQAAPGTTHQQIRGILKTIKKRFRAELVTM